MATSLFPPTLDEDSVGHLIATLQQTLYPRPSRGLTVRLGILWALTGAMILLALNYLILHALRSKERPRWRSLWLARVVERPGGSYVVLNPRPIWALTATVYGVYELLFTGLFWRVYVLQQPQYAWNGIRSFDAVAFFICGWLISWSGLQSFLLATESDASYLPSARLANALFVGGGLFLLALNLGFAVATTVLVDKFIHRYQDLLDALSALNQRLAGRVPTSMELQPVQAPAEAFAQAGNDIRIPLVLQFAVFAITPAAAIAINLGGLALARKLRAQIGDSVKLMTRADPHVAGIIGQKEEKSEPLLTFSAIKRLATQSDANGRTHAAHLQARKVLALERAAQDLQIVTLNITFVSACILGFAIWLAWCAATDKFTSGKFAYIEGTAMSPQWMYSIAVLLGLVHLHYNAFVIDRRNFSADNPTAATPAGALSGATGAAIMVTVKQEQVCDGDTCAKWYAQQEEEDVIAPDQRV